MSEIIDSSKCKLYEALSNYNHFIKFYKILIEEHRLFSIVEMQFSINNSDMRIVQEIKHIVASHVRGHPSELSVESKSIDIIYMINVRYKEKYTF